MRENEKNDLTITPSSKEWQASHSAHPFGGPSEIDVAGTPLLRDCHFYLDDLGSRQVLLQERREYQQKGMKTIKETGFFPFGTQPGFEQLSRYGPNYVRITFDLLWPSGSPIERHLGIGSFFLPGQWKSYFCIPPAQHLREGATPGTTTITQPEEAESPRMIGHWHRPPLALVFHRDDGTRLELGAGGDVWRWQQSLHAGPERGSYKIMAESAGLRIIREPLMTCQPYTPPARRYRFQWYLAWDRGVTSKVCGRKSEPAEHEIFLDPDSLPTTGFRLSGQEALEPPTRTSTPCWLSPAASRVLKRRIRQLAGLSEQSSLSLRQFEPGVCCDASHLQRGKQELLPHWDMDAILDIANWTRCQLGNNWRISSAPNELQKNLPSYSKLFETCLAASISCSIC